MNLQDSLRLYVVTDRGWLKPGETLEQTVDEILGAGGTFLQVREKELPFFDFLDEAVKLREIARQRGVPFVVNDSIEIAKRCGADGVHVGQGDENARAARAVLGPDAIVGVSAGTVEQAKKAEADGASYLGVGDIFGTGTKPDAKQVSIETLKEICAAVSIPVIAIGGIKPSNIGQLKGTGICGTAVISTLFAAGDKTEATKEMRRCIDETVCNF